MQEPEQYTDHRVFFGNDKFRVLHASPLGLGFAAAGALPRGLSCLRLQTQPTS